MIPAAVFEQELPYRRRLVGLPLQQSMFSQLSLAPEVLGLASALPNGTFGASINENGDLRISHSHVLSLIDAVRLTASIEWASHVELELRCRIDDLVQETRRAETQGDKTSSDDARRVLARLEWAVGRLLCCGLLSKFVPDVLAELGRQHGDERSPPVTTPSAGVRLSRALGELVQECLDQGHEPGRLASNWPDVPPAVRARVLRFSRAHGGFGPLPWDAPGYEDPLYVINMMLQLDGGLHANLLGTGNTTPDEQFGVVPAVDEAPGLRRLLTFWLHFLDYETFYVRRAFFVGILPALRVLYRELLEDGFTESPTVLLFARIEELTQGRLAGVELERAAGRRLTYEANREYLAGYGISSSRLDDLMNEAR